MNPFFPAPDFLQHFLSEAPLAATEIEFDTFRFRVIEAGIIELIPKVASTQDIVISAGVHGNETAPIEIVNQLVTDILKNRLRVKNRILILLGNVLAMKQSVRFVEHNMNRLFNGAHKSAGLAPGYELERAATLERAVDQFFSQSQTDNRLHLDLHTAIRGSYRERFAIYPFSDKRQLTENGLKILAGCAVNTALIMETSGPTFSSHSGLHWGAQSFTVELGRVAPFGENDLPAYADVKQTLESLFCAIDLDATPEAVEQFRVSEVIEHTGQGFDINISEDGFNFSAFETGQWVWKDKQTTRIVGSKTQYLVFPNTNVAKGQRAGLLVEKI